MLKKKKNVLNNFQQEYFTITELIFDYIYNKVSGFFFSQIWQG